MRRVHASHANHERWLVSYADFITLLFAFFVVMFASTQADRQKAKAVSDSVREALEHGQFSSAISTVLGRGRHDARRQPVTTDPDRSENLPPPPVLAPVDLRKSMLTLEGGLRAELESGKVKVQLDRRGLVISMREAAFFASGDDRVAPGGIPIIEKIASVVRAMPQPLRIEGYTDSVPIHNSRFRSNWELSTARAIAMLQLFNERFQIPSGRMAVAGYAENAPADSNDTEIGRAHNRRVDLVILSAEGEIAEPGHTGKTANP